MGISHSALPELATLVIGFTTCSMAVSMWTNSRTKSGYATAFTFIAWYNIAIRYGLNVHNPLSLYVGDDAANGLKIFTVILHTLCLIYGLLGVLVASVTGICGPIPVYALFPGTAGIHNAYQFTSNGFPIIPTTGLHRWGMFDLPRPYFAVFMNMICFIIAVIVSHVCYEAFTGAGSSLLVFFLTLILCPAFGTFLAWVGNRLMPSAYIFGAHKRNIKELDYRYPSKGKDLSVFGADVKRDTAATNTRINMTFLVIGIFHILGNLILGILRFANDRVDANWIGAVCVAGAILIIVCIIGAVYRFWPNGDGDDCVQYAAVVPEKSMSREEERLLEEEDEANVKEEMSTASSGMTGLFRRVLNAGSPVHNYV